tara:strand:- start:350 stop:1744 length:1395 start_codon:yes stop_codon:yes gene_type:complete
MAFLIGGANSLVDETIDVSNSLKFRSANSAQMSQGNGTQTNAKKWSVSFWIKLVAFADASRCVYSATGSSSTGSSITFVNNTLVVGCQGVSETDWVGTLGSSSILFRDPSAWYNICIGFDSTQGTAANRLRGYVNGVEHTFNTLTSPTQDEDSNFNNGSDSKIGGNITNNSHNLDAYITQFYFIDGTQKAASDFGLTNSNGVWVPKKYTGAFGNNGTFVEGDSTTADASGNGNNYGQSNVVITTDTPSNNFCTLNPIDKGSEVNTVTEGNLAATWNGANGDTIRSTMAVANGKWYWETANADNLSCGIVDTEERIIPVSGNRFPGGSGYGSNDSFGYILSSGTTRTNNSNTSYGEVVDNGEILMCALDLDNGKIFWGVDGTWQNSGDPANGTNPAYTGITTGSVFFSPGWGYQTGGSSTVSVNFGNPPFAISSTQADDNGYGSFEYDVPTGYYALCTKNLAEFG